MKKIFIAATQQNDGKTTLSLGLILNLLKEGFKSVSFIKPIGQRYLVEEGIKVDEDSVLIEEILGIKEKLKDMNPIAVEKGFTESYILSPNKEAITSQIKDSFERISKGSDLVIIEGTGHAGVGSVFDHSNAYVAKLFGAKILLISSGGLGRPIDEIVLNKSLFDREGVDLLGVVINKVLPEKYDKINKLIRLGLKYKGIEVLGVIPYCKELSYPSIRQILEETDFELISGYDYVDNKFSCVVVGAMKPRDAFPYIVDDCLLITPVDRIDIIKLALNTYRNTDKKRLRINCLVLSGKGHPSKIFISIFDKNKLPVLLSKRDTYTTTCILNNINVKIRPQDKEKIKIVENLVANYVDIKKILNGI
ncbi:MAG: AAA family ATPase [Candidatus Omnitrophica bacterium]|nr:AAA family ATPase [Candidatus Omnitrophota bacterium]